MPKPYASGIVPASADQVWELVKQFNGLPGWLTVPPAQLPELTRAALAEAAAGRLRPVIGQWFALARAADTIGCSEVGRLSGASWSSAASRSRRRSTSSR